MDALPCPFVYANGKQCSGRVVRVEVYKADIEWREGPEGEWVFDWSPRSHYHLFCSEKGNHAGYKRRDAGGMKFYFNQLPDAVRTLVESTSVPARTRTL